MFKGLGDHPRFRPWAIGPQAWGPDGASSVTLGPGVTDDLVAGVADFSADVGAALGCVYRFTDDRLARLLADFEFCTIVVDKSSDNDCTRMLADRGSGFPLRALASEGLGGFVTPQNAYQLEAVRALGYSRGGRPLLHAKLLLLGHVVEHAVDTGVGELVLMEFEPWRVWSGSANWTTSSAQHLEVGSWSNDPALMNHALKFLAGVVALSETFGSGAKGPSPDLAALEPNYEMLDQLGDPEYEEDP